MAALSQAGVKLLWQHDAAQVIGSWLSIAEDSRGLFVRGQLNLDVAKAREVYALMKEGAVDGLSIGFRTQKSVTDPATGVRRLQKVDLWEISIVTFPMLPNARVSSVKHLHMKARLAAAIERGSAQIAAQNARRAMDVRLTRAIERGTQLMARKYAPDQPRDELGRWTISTDFGIFQHLAETSREKQDRCHAQCEHLMGLDSGNVYRGCYRRCMGQNLG